MYAKAQALFSSDGIKRPMLVLLAVALLAFWSSLVTGQAQETDSLENLRAALNLERTGTISDSQAAPFRPSMQREPLPSLVGAMAVRIVDGLLGEATDPTTYFAGERVKLLKYQNILWLLILSASVFAAARLFALSFYGALLCVVLINLLLLDSEARKYMLDSLYTEAPAAALLTLASVLLSTGVARSSLLLTGLAGLVFGLLTLVKASFLYITIGVAASIVVLSWLQQRSLKVAAQHAAVLCAALALAVVPWLLRNYVTFGSFNVAGRGGENVFIRGTMDQMTTDEYIGGYSYWAPYPLNGVLRRVLGYSRTDATRIGGRLQHLNSSHTSDFAARDWAAFEADEPQNTFSYFLRSEAEYRRLITESETRGDENPQLVVDRQLMTRGSALVHRHAWMHLALTPLLLWRGAFFAFPPLAAAFVWAVRRRKEGLAMLTLPALAMLLFYALLTLFEPRFCLPAQPLAVCAAVALCAALCKRLRAYKGFNSWVSNR